MRTLLFNPPFMRFMGREQNYPPLGLAYVGTYLRDVQKHKVAIRNLEMPPAKLGLKPRFVSVLQYSGYSDLMDQHRRYLQGLRDPLHPLWFEVIDALDTFEPDEVGITARSVQAAGALGIASIVKAWDPSVTVRVGGIHATAQPGYFARSDYVDEVVVGDFGIINDISTLPIPDRDLFLEEYGQEGLGHLLSSIGCPFSCTFCAQAVMWGHRARFRSIDHIVREMAMLSDRYGVSCFTFWDDCLTVNRARVRHLCRSLSDDWTWRCDTRLDCLDLDLVRDLYAGGCRRMSVGVESGSDRVLHMMKKGETVARMRTKAAMLRQFSEMHPAFLWRAYVLVGYPGETREEVQATWDLLRDMGPDRVCLSTFAYYPGTLPYNQALIDRRIPDSYAWEEHSHQTAGGSIVREFAHWVDEYNRVRGGWEGWIAESTTP